jgi:elongation factor P
MAYSMSDLKKNLKIELEGVPYNIVEYQHVKPGKGAAFVRTKIKSLLDGRVIEKTFHAGDKADEPNLERRKYQYSYNEDGLYFFMDNETYDMLSIPEENIEYEIQFLLDGMEIEINFHNNKAIGIELPQSVELEIIDTPLSSKGDRQGACRKPAKVNTGATITIPCHLNTGDKIKVDTRTGDYLEKVK